MITRYIYIACLMLFFQTAQASVQDSTKHLPGQVSFFYPLGTNGLSSPDYTNNVSFNILYGYNGGFTGLELGGLVNVNKGDIQGLQMAGLVNTNLGKANGVIVGGIANIVKEESNAIYFAGVSNVSAKSVNGVQFGGISNTINGDAIAVQFGGIMNSAHGNMYGGQFGGISNINTGNLIGIQVAGISNVNGGDLIGGQMGLLNRAKNITGFQLGLFNFAESYKNGAPIGLFSWVKNGYHVLEIAGGESIYANANLKIGVEKLYTIYKFGLTRAGNQDYYSYGLGLGSLFKLSKRIGISIDVSGNHVQHKTYFSEWNFLAKGDLSLRYGLGKRFDLFAGPSFNVYIAEHPTGSDVGILNTPELLYTEKWWNNSGSTALYIGGNFGASFKF